MTSAYQLLICCARIKGDAAFYATLDRLVLAFDHFGQWDELVDLAELHGMAPLLYTHLRKISTPLPVTTKRQLQGLYLRHKRANQTRFEALEQIISLLKQAQIPAVLLKGAVLAPLIYPELALRPMRDLDILVPKHEANHAQQILHDAEYNERVQNEAILAEHHHLPTIIQETDYLKISVEVHFGLKGGFLQPMVEKSFEQFWRSAETFSIHGTPGPIANRLGNEEMLWHLYTHMLTEEMRAIRIVDLVQFSESFVAQIDWEHMRHDYPKVLNTLVLLHFVTPLSAELQQKIGLPLGKKPHGIDSMLSDWPPKLSLQNWQGQTLVNVLKGTLFPSEATLKLYYGLENNRSIVWYRAIQHPLRVVLWSIKQRFAWRSARPMPHGTIKVDRI